MLKTTFSNKRVFVTGHTGFKGSWLSLWLSMLGAEVHGYSLLPPSTPHMFDLIGLGKDIRGTHGDIRDIETLKRAMTAFSPDVVIHMAAQPLVRRSYAEPVETFSTNVLGTVNVMEAIRKTASVRAMVNITSDKCYENTERGRPFLESDPMGGSDPYSASKGCAELAVNAWRTSFFYPDGPSIVSVRAGNVIGGGDFGEDRLLPDMVRAFSQGEPVRIRSPKAIRPWQFVLEPLSGYLLLVHKLLSGESQFDGGWNFGPNSSDTLTVGEVVSSFTKRWGKDARCEMDHANHPHEAGVLRLDCTKAKRELGWTPRTGIDTAIDWSTKWYKTWYSNPAALRSLSEKQIQQFEAM